MLHSDFDDDGERNHAIICDDERLEALPMPEVDAALCAELVHAPAQMLRGLLSGSDDDYLEWIVEQLQRMTKMPFVMIGELHGEDWDRLRSLELRTPAGRSDNVVYDLLGTPCDNVVGQVACIYPKDVAKLFPTDEMLTEMGVQSYMGMPLFDPGGRPLGLVALLDHEPLNEPRMRETLSLVLAFRPRIETVLINRRTRRDMELLSERITATDDDDIDPIGHLAVSFAHAMHVRGVFVSSFVDGARGQMRTAALVVDGELRDNTEFASAGTPLAEVELAGEVLIRDDLTRSWPDAPELAQFDASACLVLSLAGANGQPIGHLGLIHDRRLNRRIGEQPVVRAFKQQIGFELARQQLEAKRLATERRMVELQRAESLGLLAGGVAHDFNNLLVGVLGNVDLALLDCSLYSEANEAREYLVDIRDAARSAMQLCRQMLAYAGRTTIETTHFELGAEIDQLKRLLAASISRNTAIDVERGAGPSWVNGDPVQIRQLLMNLVTNAGDAIGDRGGRIGISLSRVSASNDQRQIHGVTGALPPGRYICLSVRDDGCGMNAATLERIFDPFFTTKPNGHGLGLAAMLGVVRAHQGTFTVTSELGVGTNFCVYLPQVEPNHRNVLFSTSQSADRIGCVLLVDDDVRVRKVATRMLERAGYHVVTAVDGLDALERYDQEAQAIDYVMLDLGMPRLGGLETMQRLRGRTPQLRVILSSGNSERGALEAVADDAACRVLHKPYEYEQLVRALTELG
jgi:signal transduction histidine kinase